MPKNQTKEPTQPEEVLGDSIDRLHSRLDEMLTNGKKKRDIWDIAGIVTSAITGVLLGGAGLWFTNSYNNSQLANAKLRAEADRQIKEVELVAQFVPHFEQGGRRQTAAFLAISALGNSELMIELVRLYGGAAAADALASAAHRATTNEERKAFFAAFVSLVQEDPSLGSIGDREERTREVTTVEYRDEERIRSVEVTDPETGEVKEVEETYTVKVPVQNTNFSEYSVFVPRPLDIDSSLRNVLEAGPLLFGEVESILSAALSVPPDSLPALRRQLRMRTHTIETGSDAGKVRYHAIETDLKETANQ